MIVVVIVVKVVSGSKAITYEYTEPTKHEILSNSSSSIRQTCWGIDTAPWPERKELQRRGRAQSTWEARAGSHTSAR